MENRPLYGTLSCTESLVSFSHQTMKIVKVTGTQIDWDSVEDVESLETFAARMEKRMGELGLESDRFLVVPPRKVEHSRDGIILEVYHVCQGPPYRLI